MTGRWLASRASQSYCFGIWLHLHLGMCSNPIMISDVETPSRSCVVGVCHLVRKDGSKTPVSLAAWVSFLNVPPHWRWRATVCRTLAAKPAVAGLAGPGALSSDGCKLEKSHSNVLFH